MNNSETVYREMLQKSLNRITDEITLLETQNSKLLNIVTNSSKRLERLRLEQEQIQQELKSRSDTNQTKVDGIATKFIDDRIKAISEKEEDYSKRITELESLKKEVNSNITRAIINRRMNHEIAKRQRLRGAKNLINGVQKAMMMPKHIVDRYRLGKYSKRQGNVNYYNNQVNLVEAKKNALNPEQSIIDKAKSAYYDWRGKHYTKKLSKANKLLEKLQNKGSKTHILGANAAGISKQAADNIRKRNQQQMPKEEQPERVVTQQPKMEERQLPAVISQAPIPENITAATLAEEAVRSANENKASTRARAA